MLFLKGLRIYLSKGLLNVFILANILLLSQMILTITCAVITSIIYVGASLFSYKQFQVKENMTSSNDYRVRYVQSATSILGIHAVIGLVTSIIFFLSNNSESIIFVILLATIYSWLIYGYIFKHALDCTTFMGLSISFLYSMIIGFMLIIVLSLLI